MIPNSVRGWLVLMKNRHFDSNFWMSNSRLSRALIAVLAVLVIASLIIYIYAPSDGSGSSEILHNQKFEFPSELSGQGNDIKLRIEEMMKIKISVNNELRDLEAKRQSLHSQLSVLGLKIEELKSEAEHKVIELDRLKLSIKQAEMSYRESLEKNQPELMLPSKLLLKSDLEIFPVPSAPEQSLCSIYSCIDFSRCSLISNFPIYVYPIEESAEDRLSVSLIQTLSYNPHITKDPKEACLFIVITLKPDNNFRARLFSLPYWAGDGRNHIIINAASSSITSHPLNSTQNAYGRAMIVQSAFQHYRPQFDLCMPPLLGPPGNDVWHELPSVSPARRQYLISYAGPSAIGSSFSVKTILQKFATSGTSDKFLFHFDCTDENEADHLCGSSNDRESVLKQSTFVLIFLPDTLLTSSAVQTRLYEALKYGAIPIVIGDHNSKYIFPYDDVIDWKRALAIFPVSRLPELHFYTRAVTDRDILAMRLHGRMIWEKYFGSIQSIVDSVIAVYRHRIGIPPPAVVDEPSPSFYDGTAEPIKTTQILQDLSTDLDESLGPIEPPYPSPKYQRNFTFSLLHGYDMWNKWMQPFYLFPHTPFDPVMPSESKFLGSGLGFRPIAGGAGGSGKEFSESLGGNYPREHFTIVLLTYEREQVLIESLARLNGLPYLHKVIVVWNSPRPPSSDLKWPEIGVKIHVIRTLKNSLNNRFLPYDAIETEAVLSVDDDAHLRHDEIIFGFRVWREHRDRIVGFPGRFHAWDLTNQKWNYNSNYSCELSMVLTGAAFHHKYYNYLYSYVMPQAIRDKVDEFMNCEDIAMNFLVSHVTRQPPVKVTSRWTFRCPGCPVSLSEDETHFQERHECINFFMKVYGYMPLLNTQFRVDSVLFKTRIPHDKQKCFKFI